MFQVQLALIQSRRHIKQNNKMLKNLFLFALITIVCANEEDLHAELKSAYRQSDAIGNFKYGYEVSNGVEAKAEGNVNSIHGEYFLPGENGEKIRVTYTADSTGFHPKVEAK